MITQANDVLTAVDKKPMDQDEQPRDGEPQKEVSQVPPAASSSTAPLSGSPKQPVCEAKQGRTGSEEQQVASAVESVVSGVCKMSMDDGGPCKVEAS